LPLITQVALLETLKYFGVTPDMVIGHSAGETAAAYAAGLLTLKEAVKVSGNLLVADGVRGCS
jgi:acyl transferase domain-containing protein